MTSSFSTDQDYYADTSYISSSMIKAYLRSPAYYKALYIDHSIDGPDSAAIDFGQALDTLLTEGEDSFHKKFSCAVLKKDDPETFEKNKTFDGVVLSTTAYNAVRTACDAVRATSAYKWIVDNAPVAQTILTGEIDGVKVKGKLDWLNIVEIMGEKVAVITDLKTTTNLHPTKYFYHALDFSYDVQMAMYRELVRQNYYYPTSIVCQHLVVTKNDWPQVATFTFSPTILDRAFHGKVLPAIRGINDGDFKEKDVSWNEAYFLEYKEQVAEEEKIEEDEEV